MIVPLETAPGFELVAAEAAEATAEVAILGDVAVADDTAPEDERKSAATSGLVDK